MSTPTPKRLCLYCGLPTKKGGRGEHIIQEAIGGALTLLEKAGRAVCIKCNSEVLGPLDKELCSRSYLSILASREIDAHLWQAWDVDHAADNLLVEARPAWADDECLNSLICYPQITFERTGPDIRGNAEEVERFGREEYAKMLFKAVRECFHRYRDGAKRTLHFERVQSGLIYDGYRLAPRVFTQRSIFEIARNISKQSFVLRYATDEDKSFALHSLAQLNGSQQIKGWSAKPGSSRPTIATFFDIGLTLRALMKIGLNLVAAYSPNTPVNHETFAHAIRVIRGDVQIPPRVIDANGFVRTADIQAIKAARNEHSFRLIHANGVWHIYSSFFGGAIGAYVRIVGPNHEEWNCADIVAPIKSKAWGFRSSPILPIMKAHVAWGDSEAIMPSFKLQESVSKIRVTVESEKNRGLC